MTSNALREMRTFTGQRVQRTDLPSCATACPMAQCIYCQFGMCDDASVNKGNSDAACHRMVNRKVLAMLQERARSAAQENAR